MLITKRWLQTRSACTEGIEWVVKNCKDGEAIDVIRALMAHKLDWANWLIVRIMDRQHYLAYAIYAAEQVIDIYEKKYPSNNKPRLAIEAAKKVLDNDTKDNRAAAAAAAYAAAAAAYDAAASAAASAAAAAAAYADAAYADAAYAAAAAYDAAAAAAYADAAAAAKKQMQIKILDYGINLLMKGK